jgi:hypothetical protein
VSGSCGRSKPGTAIAPHPPAGVVGAAHLETRQPVERGVQADRWELLGGLGDDVGELGEPTLLATQRHELGRGEAEHIGLARCHADRERLRAELVGEREVAGDVRGVANLYLAGDWTKNGLDAGCVEAAVTSGMLCSRAITGQPTEIAGIGGWLASDAIRPEDELTASAR